MVDEIQTSANALQEHLPWFTQGSAGAQAAGGTPRVLGAAFAIHPTWSGTLFCTGSAVANSCLEPVRSSFCPLVRGDAY